MKNELLKKIMMILTSEGVNADFDKIRNKIVIALDDYDIIKTTTEIDIYRGDDIAKYINMFLISKRVAGRTERTLKKYGDSLKMFFREINKSPLEIVSDDIKMFIAIKDVRDNASKVYQKNLLRDISSFYTWMMKEEYVMKNPMNKVEEIKAPKIKKQAFTEEELIKMRLKCDGDIRLQCMFEMLVSTWCRITELVQIKLTDIADNHESVMIFGKGQKERICYINASAKIYLERYLAERKDNNIYLFPNCKATENEFEREAQALPSLCKKYKVKLKDWWMVPELVGINHVDKGTVETRIRKLGKAVGTKAHPHKFRRTGATFALRRGMPIEKVSKLLGHESIETTQAYLDIQDYELESAHRKYV